nr:EOG090X084E [Moina brachiata]
MITDAVSNLDFENSTLKTTSSISSVLKNLFGIKVSNCQKEGHGERKVPLYYQVKILPYLFIGGSSQRDTGDNQRGILWYQGRFITLVIVRNRYVQPIKCDCIQGVRNISSQETRPCYKLPLRHFNMKEVLNLFSFYITRILHGHALKVNDQDQSVDLSDKVFHSLLMHSYNMFCLFMGTLKSALTPLSETSDEFEQLKLRTSYFFPKHLQLVPLHDADLADAFLGVQFLPLDKLSFLKIRSLVNHIEQTFPWIGYTTVLYQDQIVWSGLNPKDVQLVYNYLTTKLIPASSTLNSDSRYLTGPLDLSCATSEMRIPRVFLNIRSATPDECHLIVYRMSGITTCLFAPSTMELAREFFLTLDTLVGPRLTALSADLVEQAILRKTSTLNMGTDSVRFMYFNQWNMAFKSTLHQSSPGHRRVLQCQLPTNNEIIKSCADICDDLALFGEGEIVIRTKSDAWVLGRLSNQRHLYVVVTRKNAELTEICDEVRRLRNLLFKDILLVDGTESSHEERHFAGLMYVTPTPSEMEVMFPGIRDWLPVKMREGRIVNQNLFIFLNIMKEQIRKRWESGQTVGDFIDTATTSLLNARKDVGNGEYKRTWTKEDAEEILIAQGGGFVVAGFETAYSILFASVYNLAKHPEIQELFYNKLQEKLEEHGGEFSMALVKEVSYADCIIKEALRMHPPVKR